MELKSKFLGAMIGMALGDAIGEMAFKFNEKEALCHEVKRADILRYTDDTAMAIGLAESIIEIGGLDHKHLGDMFSYNYMQEPWRGYGMGPPKIFYEVRRSGISYVEAARRLFGGKGSLGNGAAMRIVPVGLFFYDSEDLYEHARKSAEVTHVHPVGIDGAAVQAWAVAKAVGLNPEDPFPEKEFLEGIENFSRTGEIKAKMFTLKRLIEENAPPFRAAKTLGKGVAVDESMPFALYSFITNTNSFEDCLFCAILNGGDRDTLGAMACGVSGAYLGVERIPEEWIEKLENRSLIEKLAISLLEVKKGIAH